MKEKSTKKPPIMEIQPNFAVKFSYNVSETTEGFEYETLEIVGETARCNIIQGYLSQYWTEEEIRKKMNTDPEMLAKTAEINAIINERLGKDFK